LKRRRRPAIESQNASIVHARRPRRRFAGARLGRSCQDRGLRSSGSTCWPTPRALTPTRTNPACQRRRHASATHEFDEGKTGALAPLERRATTYPVRSSKIRTRVPRFPVRPPRTSSTRSRTRPIIAPYVNQAVSRVWPIAFVGAGASKRPADDRGLPRASPGSVSFDEAGRRKTATSPRSRRRGVKTIVLPHSPGRLAVVVHRVDQHGPHDTRAPSQRRGHPRPVREPASTSEFDLVVSGPFAHVSRNLLVTNNAGKKILVTQGLLRPAPAYGDIDPGQSTPVTKGRRHEIGPDRHDVRRRRARHHAGFPRLRRSHRLGRGPESPPLTSQRSSASRRPASRENQNTAGEVGPR